MVVLEQEDLRVEGVCCIQGFREKASLVKELLIFAFKLGSERLEVRTPLWEGIEALFLVVLKSSGCGSSRFDGRVASRERVWLACFAATLSFQPSLSGAGAPNFNYGGQELYQLHIDMVRPQSFNPPLTPSQ
jgi:hypothetical protein